MINLNIKVVSSTYLEGLFDLDFIENVEYFREDTLELGYKNEADRLINEYTDSKGIVDIEGLIHVAFSSSYYLDYIYEITDVDYQDLVYIISIAYICK